VVTGTGFDEVFRQRLFRPLGLGHTSTLPEEAILHRVAAGHIGDDLHVTPQWVLPRKSTPAGLINSTAGDVLTFAELHLDDGLTGAGAQLLSPASVKAMQEPQVAIPDPYTVGEHWGLGWSLARWDGRPVFGHGGNVLGQSAHLRVVPDARVAVALLTNVGSSGPLWRAIAGEVFGELAGVTMPSELTATELDLSVYEGRYERMSVTAEIGREDEGLVMTITSTGAVAKLLPDKAVQRVPLRPVREHVFLAEVGAVTAPVVFFDVVDGRPRYFHMGARAMPRVS
jgi:CubicO group peptidase (beta-lactamase class C family)